MPWENHTIGAFPNRNGGNAMLPSMHNDRRLPGWVIPLLGFVMTAPVWAGHDDNSLDNYADSSSYSYARIVDGPSTLLAAGGARESVEPHQPLLVGDTLWVPEDSRLEVALADRNLLRFDGESHLVFERIAYSTETEDRETVLRLQKAQLQLVVPEDALGDSLPRLETEDGTIFIHRAGTFLIRTGGSGTELVVREGLAELVTDRGSLLIHPGEMGWAEGGPRGELDVYAARRRDSLERWGDRLTEEAALASAGYVDSSLRYAAAPLESHGGWVEIRGRRGWRPRAEVDWRPYYRGYWRHTPVGYTWVSHDPWGWVTHHYGSWDYDTGYGWVWYPGRVYAPARVTWYWGQDYVGWCPTGYYSHHYRPRRSGFGLRFGVYGYAGGSWGHFADWTFTATLNFGHGHRNRYDRHHRGHGYRPHHDYHSGRQLERRGRGLNRGIITTDLGVARRRPEEVYRDLERRAGDRRRSTGRELPDVTDFVARKPLDEDVRRAVAREPRVNVKPTGRSRGDWDLGDAPLPNATRVLRDTKPGTPGTAVADGGAGRSTRRPTAVGSSRRQPIDRKPVADRGASDREAAAVRKPRATRTTPSDRREPAVATQILRDRNDQTATTIRRSPRSDEAAGTPATRSPRTRTPRASDAAGSRPQTSVRPSEPRQSTRVRRNETGRPTGERSVEKPRPTRVRPSEPRQSTTARPSDTRRSTRLRPTTERPTTERQTTARPTEKPRPTRVRPSEPRQSTSVRRSDARRPTSVRPAPERQTTVRPTEKPRPTRVRPSAPRQSTNVSKRPAPARPAAKAPNRSPSRTSSPRPTASSASRESAPRASKPKTPAKPAASKASKASKGSDSKDKAAASKSRRQGKPKRD